MLVQDTRQRTWEEYTADLLGAIQTSLCSLGGKRTEIPLFSDLIEQNIRREKKQEITTDQVVDHLLNKL